MAALVLAWPDGRTEIVEGKVYGRIVDQPRGPLGFGYDPLFQPDGHARTFGEMTAVWPAMFDAAIERFGKVDILVSAVGTGGSITGVAEVLKQRKPDFKAVAVEPKVEAAVLRDEAGRAFRQAVGGADVLDLVLQRLLHQGVERGLAGAGLGVHLSSAPFGLQ